MKVAPPQSLMGWQGAQCLAGLAALILGPEGIGLVGVPAPTRTHGVGLRDLPGHRGDGQGLVGIEGRRRSLEQVAGGAAIAVAREGGGGTAAVQACKKGEKEGETEAHLGPMCEEDRLMQEIPSCPRPGFSAKAGGPWENSASFPVSLGSSPQDRRPWVG